MAVVLLALQSIVCLVSLFVGKHFRVITFREFSPEEARKCPLNPPTPNPRLVTDILTRVGSPISLLLVLMIFTSAKALQYISIPTYTIFKNLTIILIAYGEVLWFGGSVTALALLSFGLMVLSSVVSAWADISAAITNYAGAPHETATELASLNAGYIWMLLNCLSSATYVLSMRKRIKVTQFSDLDSRPPLVLTGLIVAMFYNNLLSIPILMVASFAFEDWGAANIEQNLYHPYQFMTLTRSPADTRNRLFVAILVSGFSAVFISYCTAWCLRVTSSTTYRFAPQFPVMC